MAHAQTDRNLLLGILALQNNLVSRETLLAAFSAWVVDKSKSLGELLVEQGKLPKDHFELLDALVNVHVSQHEGSAEKSLRVLSSIESVRHDLEQLRDPELQASLMQVSLARKQAHADSASADPNATAHVSVGQATSKGLRFRILRPHAEGGLGIVSVARDEELNREVALKEIRLHFAHDEDSRARFLREAEITGGLEHPGIVPVYGLGQYADGRPFYAMRFIKGDSLKDAIEKFHGPAESSGGAARKNLFRDPARHVELRKLLQRLIDVCEAIEYAHARGVLHRDLKPGNIMLGKYGETLVVDWGLAKPSAQTRADSDATLPRGSEEPLSPQSNDCPESTMQGSAIGTPAFMPPEQALGRLDQLGPASDVYSLGATLYALLTGRPPVAGANTAEVLKKVQEGTIPRPRSLNPHLPAALEAICLKALALAPENRYASTRLLAGGVEKWLADEPVSAYAEPVRVRAGRWVRRHQILAASMGAALVVCVLAAVVGAGIVGAYNQTLSNKNKALEDSNRNLDLARNEERRMRMDAVFEQARSTYERAHLLRERGESGSFMLWLVRTMEQLELLQEQMTRDGVPLDPRVAALYRSAEMSLASQVAETPALLASFSHENARAFSPDGTKVLTISHDHTARLWDVATGEPLGEAIPHPGPVGSVMFSPDGSQVATASNDGNARLWDAATGRSLGDPLPHPSSVALVVFSPNGAKLATACGEGAETAAWLWDATTCKPIGKPMQHQGQIASIVFSPDGTKAATASYDGNARLWDATTGTPLGEPLQHQGEVTSVCFSPDGTKVGTTSFDRTARLWEASTGKPLGEVMRHQESVASIVFSPDGMKIATANHEHTARLWDASTGTPLGDPMRHPGQILSVAFNPEGTKVVTTSNDQTARLWGASSGKPLGAPLKHPRGVFFVLVEGTEVLTGTTFGARRWDAAIGRPAPQSVHYPEGVFDFIVSPDGSKVASRSHDGAARLWDAATGKPVGEPMRHPDQVTLVGFSPDGTKMATACQHTVRLWNVATATPLGEPLQQEEVWSVAFSLDGAKVATACKDHTARLWDAATGLPRGEPMQHQDLVRSVVFSRDSAKMATASDDGTARVWDATTGQPLGEPMQHHDSVETVVFSPDGTKVATASYDETARLWNATSGKPLGEPMQHQDAVQSVVFSPDGLTVATASLDRTARLWDATTSKPLGEPMQHQNWVWSVVFSRDGSQLATASEDRTARLWDAKTGKPLGEPLRHSSGVNAVAFSRDGGQLTTACDGGATRFWPLFSVRLGAPANRLRPWIETITGQRLSASGATEFLSQEEWQAARQMLAGRGGAPADGQSILDMRRELWRRRPQPGGT